MPERGGPTTESGIFFQNQVAALYLGRLIDPRPQPGYAALVEVRLEAPPPVTVDDVVLRFADGHREYIQVKEAVAPASDAWTKLWQGFAAQRAMDGFTDADRIVLLLGDSPTWARTLRELCERAAGAVDENEWRGRLGAKQRKLLAALEPILADHLEEQSPFSLFACCEVRIWDPAKITIDQVPNFMPPSKAEPLQLCDSLLRKTSQHARIRKPFTEEDLLAELAQEGIEVLDGAGRPGTVPRPLKRKRPADRFRNLKDSLTKHFTGRQEEKERLVDLCESGVGNLLIWGAPGSGKSTLMARVAQELRSRPDRLTGIIEYFVHSGDLTGSPTYFLHYLCGTLDELFELQGLEKPETALGLATALHDRLDIIEEIAPEKPVALLVDGLDEATEIGRFIPGPRAWLKVVCACRRNSDTENLADSRRREGLAELTLKPMNPVETRELMLKLVAGKRSSFHERYEDVVVNRSEGNPLFLRLLINNVIGTGDVEFDDAVSEDISRLYSRTIGRVTGNGHDFDTIGLLVLMAVVKAPLAADEIGELLGINPVRASAALEICRELLHFGDPAKNTAPVEVFHHSLRDYLKSMHETECVEANRRLATASLDWRNRTHSRVLNYLLAHGASHLLDTGDADGMWTLLRDEDYRQKQVTVLRSYRQAFEALERGLRLFSSRAPKSAVDDARLCWTALRAGDLSKEAISSVRLAIEWIAQRPLGDERRVDDAVSLLQILDRRQRLITAIALLWIESDRWNAVLSHRRSDQGARTILTLIDVHTESISPVSEHVPFLKSPFLAWWLEKVFLSFPDLPIVASLKQAIRLEDIVDDVRDRLNTNQPQEIRRALAAVCLEGIRSCPTTDAGYKASTVREKLLECGEEMLAGLVPVIPDVYTDDSLDDDESWAGADQEDAERGVRENRAVTAALTGNYRDAAEQVAAIAAEEDPQFSVSRILNELRDKDKAEESIELVQALLGENFGSPFDEYPDSLLMLAMEMRREGMPCLAALRKSLELFQYKEPGLWDIHALCAAAEELGGAGEWSHAVEVLHEALNVSSRLARGAVYLGTSSVAGSMLDMGRFPGHEPLIRRSIEIAGSAVGTTRDLALSYIACTLSAWGDLDAARDLSDALPKGLARCEPLVFAARFLSDHGRAPECSQLLNEAVSLVLEASEDEFSEKPSRLIMALASAKEPVLAIGLLLSWVRSLESSSISRSILWEIRTLARVLPTLCPSRIYEGVLRKVLSIWGRSSNPEEKYRCLCEIAEDYKPREGQRSALHFTPLLEAAARIEDREYRAAAFFQLAAVLLDHGESSLATRAEDAGNTEYSLLPDRSELVLSTRSHFVGVLATRGEYHRARAVATEPRDPFDRACLLVGLINGLLEEDNGNLDQASVAIDELIQVCTEIERERDEERITGYVLQALASTGEIDKALVVLESVGPERRLEAVPDFVGQLAKSGHLKRAVAGLRELFGDAQDSLSSTLAHTANLLVIAGCLEHAESVLREIPLSRGGDRVDAILPLVNKSGSGGGLGVDAYVTELLGHCEQDEDLDSKVKQNSDYQELHARSLARGGHFREALQYSVDEVPGTGRDMVIWTIIDEMSDLHHFKSMLSFMHSRSEGPWEWASLLRRLRSRVMDSSIAEGRMNVLREIFLVFPFDQVIARDNVLSYLGAQIRRGETSRFLEILGACPQLGLSFSEGNEEFISLVRETADGEHAVSGESADVL